MIRMRKFLQLFFFFWNVADGAFLLKIKLNSIQIKLTNYQIALFVVILMSFFIF